MGRALLVVLVILSISIAPNLSLDKDDAWIPSDSEPGAASIPGDGERPQAGGFDLSGIGGFFTENLGQRGPGGGSYYCEGDPLSVAFGRGWVSLVLLNPDGIGGACVQVSFDGARAVNPMGLVPTGGVSNFLIGAEPSSWVIGARNFMEVWYFGLYQGIDLVFRILDNRLKYEFIVSPHAEPSRILMTFAGAEGLELDEGSGDLIIRTGSGDIVDAAPVAFQERVHGRTLVESSYRMAVAASIGFTIGDYDHTTALVIDPALVFSTLIGGPNNDTTTGNTFIDEHGHIYISGSNHGGGFPTTPGALQTDPGDQSDMLVVMLNSSLKVISSTYIGGSDSDYPGAMFVDDNNIVYVTGTTASNDLPKPAKTDVPAYDSSFNGGTDIFVIKLNLSAPRVLYTNYIGGSGSERGSRISVDMDGCAYVTGTASNRGIPTSPSAYDATPNGETDIVVLKLSAHGDKLIYSTFLGGSRFDYSTGLQVDQYGNAIITGTTNSEDFPTTTGALQTTWGGSRDVLVSKLSADGRTLMYSTFIGGSTDDMAYGSFLDKGGLLYLTGWTESPEFPTTEWAYERENHGYLDAFVLRLSIERSELVFSTLIGGEGQDRGEGIWVDEAMDVYVCGFTDNEEFPTTPNAFDRIMAPYSRDGFVCRFDMNGSRLTYSSFIGGIGTTYCRDVVVDRSGAVFLTGDTDSIGFPTTDGAYDTSPNGMADLFAMKLLLGPSVVEPLNLTGGPRFFAGYKDYDFTVDINPWRERESARTATLILDPGSANVSLMWDPTRSSNPFYEESDSLDLVTLLSTPQDLRPDDANGTSMLHFRVMFGWSWPHEGPCDVLLKLPGLSGQAGEYRLEDVFSVENDLELVGDISVRGELQGPITEGAWVRAGETLTFSGPVVVYEGTTEVYPPAGCCNVTLRDDEGDGTTAPNPCGQPIELTIQADAVTDPSERLSLGLIDLPGTAESRADLSFALRVDGELPTFENPVPEPDDWHGSSDVMVSITINDSSTSGVDASSIEYSCSEGTGPFGPWTALSLEVTGDGPVADGLVTVRMPDGADNFIRWRAKDLVGNGWAVSDPLRIKVDTRNVTFRDPVPDPDRWFVTLQVPCGVTIDDLEGAGIDVSTVQWRTSPTNLSHYGPWNDWDEGARLDNGTVLVRATLDLAESGRNYVQWRAMDIAGNGFTTSPHYRVRTDVSPVEFTGFEPGEDLPQNRTEVTCWVTAIDRPGGSGVNLSSIEYRWGYDAAGGAEWSDWTSSGMEGVMMQTWFSIVLELRHGPGNLVQLRGSDQAGNGPTASAILRVTVDTVAPTFVEVRPEPTDKQSDPDVLVTLTLRDDFTGVDRARVEYRTGPGPTRLGEWSPMAVVPQTLGDISGSVRMLFAPGRDNYFQFRAFDLAGNEAISTASSIWVNRPPVAIIASPAESAALLEGETVWLSANGTIDPDEDVLTYAWLIDGTAIPDAVLGVVNVTLNAGFHNITLVVTDDVGAVSIAEVLVNVEEVPPPVIQKADYSMYLVILIVLIITSILFAIYLHVKRHRTP